MPARKNGRADSDMLTVGQVAEWINVHPNTVRRWAQQGVLTSYRIGSRGDRRFLREDVQRLLNGGPDIEWTPAMRRAMRERGNGHQNGNHTDLVKSTPPPRTLVISQ